MSLEASTTRDMAEKKEVIISAVLEPSSKLLKINLKTSIEQHN